MIVPKRWPSWRDADLLRLPARCPWCAETVVLLHDNALEWLCCTHCSRSGVPLEFFAQYWNLSLSEALTRWQEQVLPGGKGELLSSGPENIFQRQRLEQLWQQATEQLWQNPSVFRGLRLTLHEPVLSPQEWQLRGGRLLGLLSRAQLEPLFGKRLLPGRWNQTLVVPLLGQPRQLVGFWLVTDEGGTLRHRVVGRAGLLFSPGIFPTGELTLLMDFKLALECQLRHLAYASEPLPLLGYNAESVLPNYLAAHHPVFWLFQPQAEFFLQTRYFSGRYFQDSASLAERLQTQTPARCLQQARKRAVERAAFLDLVLSQQTLEAIPEFLRLVGLTGSTLQRHLEGSQLKLQQRVQQAQAAVPRQAQARGKTVLARADGWYLLDGSRISNWRLELDEIALLGPQALCYYQGRLCQENQTIPVAFGPDFVLDPFQQIETVLLQKQCLLLADRRWSGAVLELAKEFATPCVLSCPQLYGLQEDGLIDLPGWSWSLPLQQCQPARWVPPPVLPLGWDPPLLPSWDLAQNQQLLEHPDCAEILCLVAWLFYSLTGRPGPGRLSQAIPEGVEACGLRPQSWPVVTALKEPRAISFLPLLQLQQLGQLYQMTAAGGVPPLTELPPAVPRNWLVLDSWPALALAVTASWRLTSVFQEPLVPELVLGLCRGALESKSFTKSLENPAATEADLLESLIALLKLETKKRTVFTQKLLTRYTGGRAQALSQLVTELLRQGRLTAVPPSFYTASRGQLCHQNGAFWLTPNVLNQALRQDYFSLTDLLEALLEIEPTLTEQTLRGQPGLWLQEAWLTRRRLRVADGSL